MTFEARPRCCPCGEHPDPSGTSLTRRDFLKGAGMTALGSVAAGGLAWPLLGGRAEAADEAWRPAPLKVKPILVYDTPTRRPQTSWRNWGGIETEAQARDEVARIEGELAALAKRAEFPLEFLPVSAGPEGRGPRRGPGPGRRPGPSRLRGRRLDGRLRRLGQDGQGPHLVLPPQVRPGLPLVRDHQPALPPEARRQPGRQGRRRGRRRHRQPGRASLALPGPGRAAQHAGHQDPGRRRAGRLVRAGRARLRGQVGHRHVEVRHRHGVLRRPGPAHPRGPGRRRGRAPGPVAGRRLPPAARDEPGDGAVLRRERAPPRRGLPGPDEEGRRAGP